jgi:hypothetical protein
MIVTFLVSNSVLAAAISRTFTTYRNGNGRPTGFYGILSGTSNISPIIKIVEVDGSVSSTSPTNSIYCFRAGAGFGSQPRAVETTYTNSMSLLQARNSLPSEYRTAVPGTDTDASNYNSAVALLQIFADVDDTTSINNMLSTITNNKVQYSHFNDYASINQTGYQKDIIEAVQQAALWYFTNPTGNFHPIYDFDEGLEPTFKFSSTNSGYINLSNKSTGAHRYQYGTEYYYPAEYLFMKLVDYGLSKKNVVPSASSSSSASTFNKSNREVVDLENSFDLSKNDIDRLKIIDKEVGSLRTSFNDLNDCNRNHSFPYSKLNKELDFLIIKLSKIDDSLDYDVKTIGSMKEDEARAREQLDSIKDLIKKARNRIRLYNIPVIPDNYYVELTDASDAIKEINKELNRKPINIDTLNIRVDTARDLAFKVFNTTNDLIKNVMMAEETIVYGNRYRSVKEQVDIGLTKAEELFREGSYRKSIEVSMDAIDYVEPGIHNKILNAFKNEGS